MDFSPVECKIVCLFDWFIVESSGSTHQQVLQIVNIDYSVVGIISEVMEGIKNFLESSTIHGLTYISSTKKYARAFWMLVVISGFSLAGYLIYESFQSWEESPVKTTIETLPIIGIKFPKVTVCPKKNTFTDLNYDLMMAEDANFDHNEAHQFINDVIDEHVFMDEWNKLYEENRYSNWYHGFTKINPPYEDFVGRQRFKISTYALSGTIYSNMFGQQFDQDIIGKNKIYAYSVTVCPPESLKNESISLNIKIEKVSITGMSEKSSDKVYTESLIGEIIDVDKQFFLDLSPPACHEIAMLRFLNNKDKLRIKMDIMPGFKVSWNYTGIAKDVTPENKYFANKLDSH